MRVLLIVAASCGLVLGAPAAKHPKHSKRHAAVLSGKRKSLHRKKARHIATGPRVSVKARAAATASVVGYLQRPTEAAIENSSALVPFFEQLIRYQRGEASEDSTSTLRILQYGDSHTAADEWTADIRSLLQGQFGDGGAGYSLAGRPWNSYRHADLRSNATGGWYSDGLVGRAGDGRYGLGGVSISTARAGESISLAAECERAELFYLQQPGGGDIEFEADGQTVETIRTEGETQPGYFVYKTTPGAHKFSVRTLSAAPVRLFGWVTEKNKGVTYEELGINGAQASIMLNWDDAVLGSNIARRNPALVVLAYGTNEAGGKDWTYATYRDMFTGLIAKLRRATPLASILVLGPPDRYYYYRGHWAPLEKVGAIIAAQRDASLASGCAFWDTREKMGGAGAMRQWVLSGLAQYDHVHFTGSGYGRLGSAMYRDLMNEYATFTKARDQVAVERVADEQASKNR